MQTKPAFETEITFADVAAAIEADRRASFGRRRKPAPAPRPQADQSDQSDPFAEFGYADPDAPVQS